MPGEPPDHGRLLDAVAFAARAHRHHLRKDGRTPYASHVFRVCLVLRHVFGVEDPDALAAALLHDTIEDTTTDFDDLKEHFGGRVAGWVGHRKAAERVLHRPRRRQRYGYRAAVQQSRDGRRRPRPATAAPAVWAE